VTKHGRARVRFWLQLQLPIEVRWGRDEVGAGTDLHWVDLNPKASLACKILKDHLDFKRDTRVCRVKKS
jgi:hypothetical protein